MNPAWAIAAVLIGVVVGGVAWSEWRLRRRHRRRGPGSVRLGIRLRVRRWRLRKQPIPTYGKPLTDAETHAWMTALHSFAAAENAEVAMHERDLEDHLCSGCCEQHRAPGEDHAREPGPGGKDQSDGEGHAP